jgi:hypothetical protein
MDGLLAEVRAGRSRVLAVRGEAGIGKTALLGYTAEAAQDFRVARAEGIESEMELPFAALHQLCERMLDRLDRLPGPQRDAQALAFVARRLDAESVALLFGTRDRAGDGGLTGLPGLTVEGLSEAEARALLASVLPGRLDDRVRDRIVAESGGNPLALLELPSGVTAADLAGGFGVAGPLPVAGRIEGIFERRLAPLPAATRWLTLLAAAEPTGDPALLWRAAGGVGIDAAAAAPAEAGGLLTVAGRVTFRHPLVRSAVYQAAWTQDRRQVHRALAEATDPQVDPDRRAWHRAQAAAGPDEDVAAELERSAGRAQARRVRGGRRLPGPGDRADTRSGPARSARARGRLGQARRRGARSCRRAARDREDGPARRASARADRRAARPDRVRPGPRQRRSGTAAGGRQAARTARRRAGKPGCRLGIPQTRTRPSRRRVLAWATRLARSGNHAAHAWRPWVTFASG